MRGLLLFGIALVSSSLWAVEVGQHFANVDAFVKSLPSGKAEKQSFGDLTGAGRRDWVGAVYSDDPDESRSRQVVVLTQDADGRYTVAALGPVDSADEGTEHHSLDDVAVSKGSIFISWSWYWHGCGGSSRQQIKLYKNQWRVIGAEISQSNSTIASDGAYDTGDSANLSHNLLTGEAVIHFRPETGKAVTKKIHVKPTNELLDEKFDDDAGDIAEFSKYAECR